MSATLRATVLTFGLFTTGVLSGGWAGSLAAERARDPYDSLDTLVRVLGLVERTYVDDVSTDQLVQAAIDGMLHDLDPHSFWMSAERYGELLRETEGSYSGIGVDLTAGPDGAVVTRVLPGSPAAREGVQQGDRIIEIDGIPIDAEHPEAVEGIYGDRGEVAHLRVLREGWTEPTLIDATRDEVHQPSVESGRAAPGVGYARVVVFQRGVAVELQRAVERLGAESPLSTLVLDLRDNPGGLLEEAVAVADLFLDHGVIVSTWGRQDREKTVHEATAGGLPADLRLVVLVNGRSASASEIVAASLQETGRARLIGTSTYGKGSVQAIYEARDGSALKLTVGRYYTPSGQPVAPRDGREPDVVVEWPSPTSPRDRLIARLTEVDLDPATRAELTALAEALPADKRRDTPAIPWDAPLSRRMQVDPQLAAAVKAATSP